MEELQMIINAPQEGEFLREIRWNREEFEAEVDRAVKDYVGVVYGDDQIQDAKKARAELNNAKKAISARRIEVKKLVMEPYDKFEAEVKEITAKIDAAIKGIDTQIKAYEAQQKNAKQEELRAYFEEVGAGLDRYGITFDHVWSDRMLNSSASLKKCKEDIRYSVDRIRRDVAVLKGYGEAVYGAALEVYLKHTDLSEAITEAKRQREIIQRAEEEARRKDEAKAQEEEPIINPPIEDEPVAQPVAEVLPPEPVIPVQKPEGKIYTDTLTITTTPELSEQLLRYIENHGITFDNLTYTVKIDAKFRGTREQLVDFHRAMEANGIGFEKQKKVENVG